MCVCLCEGEKEKEREGERDGWKNNVGCCEMCEFSILACLFLVSLSNSPVFHNRQCLNL